MKVTKAVIPAAGFGTRFLPYTKAVPKEMLPIVDKPALQLIVEEIVASGITDILIVTGRNKQNIENHFDRATELEEVLLKKGTAEDLERIKSVKDIADLANIYFIRQKEAKGLGHAVLCAKSFVGNEPFAVLNGDDIVYTGNGIPCTKQLINQYNKTKSSIVGAQRIEKKNFGKYGVVKPKSSDGRLHEIEYIIEKPKIEDAPSDIASLGRWVLTPEIFELIETQKPGKNGEIQLTDSIDRLSKKYAYEYEGRRYDIGDKQGYLEATVEYALRDKNLGKDFKVYLAGILK